MMFIYLLAIIVVFIGVLAYQRYKWMRVFLDQGVPGLTPNFFAGSLELRRMGFMGCFQYCRKKYGRTFTMCLGGTPMIVTADANLIQRICIKNFDHFRNRHLSELRPSGIDNSIPMLTDRDWKRVRSIISSSFTVSKLTLMSRTIARKCDSFLKAIDAENKTHGKVNIYGLFRQLTIDVIGECALGMEINTLEGCKRSEQMASIMIESTNRKPGAREKLRVMFPGLGRLARNYLPESWVFNLTKTGVKVYQDAKNTIDERRKGGPRKADLIQFLLDSKHSSTERFLSESEFMQNVVVFLLAGFDTTFTALSFAAYLLALHPEVQEKLYQEMIDKVQDTSSLTFEDLRSLPYLDCVWKESLRMYPPTPTMMGRVAAKDFDTGDFIIPAGAFVLMPPMLVHQESEYWTDPKIFNPERFTNKNDIAPGSFMAFGDGPRHCLGKRFAEIEGKMALFKVIASFKLEACEETEPHPIKTYQIGNVQKPNEGAIYIRASRR